MLLKMLAPKQEKNMLVEENLAQRKNNIKQ